MSLIYRKIQKRLIPFLIILYIFAYLDRINVSFAALQMTKELGFNETTYGLGAGVFFIGYFIFEIPSNLILQKVGARKWIARIMLTWGIIACSMIFVKDAPTFYLLRFLLGFAEAGFFPGIIIYLSRWFPSEERAKNIALFMTASAVSGVIGGPLSGFLLGLHGIGGLSGWQWLFLIEGIPSILLSIMVFLFLPESPRYVKWLTSEEQEWLSEKLQIEQIQNRDEKHQSLTKTFKSPIVWGLAFVYFTICVGLYTFSFWLPQWLKSFSSIGNFQVGLLSAIPYLGAAIGMVFVGINSDKTQERRVHLTVMLLTAALGFVASAISREFITIFLSLILVAIGLWGTFGPFWSIPNQFLIGTAAAGGTALINSFGNLGGFLGPSLIGLLKDTTGSFESGLLIISLLLLTGGLLSFKIVPKPISY